MSSGLTPALEELHRGERLAQILIDDMSDLVSPPEVYVKISDMLAENTASASEFAEVILRDPSLAARVLRMVNSPYYALRNKVDTVSQAITIIGMNDLSSVVYSMCAVQSFSRISDTVTNIKTFWSHGVYCGLVAKALATRINCLQPERLFVAGLLHDIGTLTINAKVPELAEENIIVTAGSESALAATEREWLGLDHAALGALMLQGWQLPAATCEAIRFHHDPGAAVTNPLEAGLVHVADELANASAMGGFSELIAENDDIDPGLFEHIGLTSEFDSDELLAEVQQQFIETIYLLVP